MDIAFDKTIQEFKMWGSMSRKPGQPADYLRQIYRNLLIEQKSQPSGGEKFPEIQADRVWERFIKKLLQKEYRFDASFYGSLNEFSRKVAYFFHSCLQGTVCYPGAAGALRRVKETGLHQGIIADAQCLTPIQLEVALGKQAHGVDLARLVDSDLRAYSYELRARTPSERIFRPILATLARRGIVAGQVLHVGSRLGRELVPARRLGMRTAWFAANREASMPDRSPLREASSQPDVILTRLEQIAEILG
jgi:putative hydrolase of the HAD superfamily